MCINHCIFLTLLSLIPAEPNIEEDGPETVMWMQCRPGQTCGWERLFSLLREGISEFWYFWNLLRLRRYFVFKYADLFGSNSCEGQDI